MLKIKSEKVHPFRLHILFCICVHFLWIKKTETIMENQFILCLFQSVKGNLFNNLNRLKDMEVYFYSF